ncbi:MAG: RpiB/LacA/LacB family sugar-phosphate isomerase [Mangrovibacterium sp.]|jgi:ribose 5-phosphate isomerase B
MKIAIGCDIYAYSDVCDKLAEYLEKEKKFEVIKCGAMAGKDKADFVDAGIEVAEKVADKTVDYGVLLCNTGTGITIVANKVPGVRAALCYDEFAAKISKLGNNANAIALSVRFCGEKLLKSILDIWFETDPSTEEWRVNFHRKTEELDNKYRKYK